MKLILTEDVPNLGSLGDTIDVKSGYGRNYLLPKGIALLATGRVSKELQHRIQHLNKLREGKIELAHEQAEKLKTVKLEVIRKSGPGGRLFGSVTNRDLKDLLKEKEFDVERRSILLNSPIRNIGLHEFTVRVHSEVSVNMQIKVTGDSDESAVKTVAVDEPKDKNADEKNVDSEELEKLEELEGLEEHETDE
ncbi:MAG: 50S ribosomal protein L9 [Deltaproteobacteria bacterium]|nr:50S ribosomal protein L9 [Deltaproteobacteria bacterium]MCH1521035.1 50S ribosomal protein L9 [SAR324 cluster bacterium]MBT4015464.1 50S ribosomal protein L9 [Deltaproteobacteria bacterium]MBT4629005.1 50S ribosomal protein L9 [Deltaproteobacteria bacterium]MBT5087340.1 50S ribosomal protein L9 [Deltaproteobacteria bacterium]